MWAEVVMRGITVFSAIIFREGLRKTTKILGQNKETPG
jgi:hypothetical protein